MQDNKVNTSQILGILLIYLSIQTPISAFINNLEALPLSLFISLFLIVFGILLISYSAQ